MAKALVTGANGFLGSWIVRKLLDEGLDVRIIHRPKSDLSELDGLAVEKFIGDVTDLSSLQKAVQGVDHVFHAAAVIGYKRSDRDMMERVNVTGTANVVKALRNSSVQSLLYVSSVVAVGASLDGKRPLKESDIYNMKPFNFGYFETKHDAERLVLDFCRNTKFKTVIVNPSTVYGPGDAKKGSRKVQVKVAQGCFKFYTGGGVSIVHVDDVVNGIWSAFKKGRSGERYILSGENITIQQLFTQIAQLAGAQPPKTFLPNPVVKTIGKVSDVLESFGLKGPLNSESAYNSILYHWFDHSKAKAELGFKPRPAKEALAASVNWMKEHKII